MHVEWYTIIYNNIIIQCCSQPCGVVYIYIYIEEDRRRYTRTKWPLGAK